MEAGAATPPRERPGWLLGLIPLVLLAAAIAAFVALDAPGLDRNGVPVEDVAVDRTVLEPGVIEVHLRNDGPDPVEIRQAIVNDSFSTFSQSSEKIARLGRDVVKIDYPWVEGEAYEIALLTSTGGTVPATVEVAAETPSPDAGFFGLMGLVGLYVGVIPVAIGMVWLPWLRRSSREMVRFLLSLTVGLLAFLGIDALLEGIEFAGSGAQAFGGAALVWVGAVVAYIALAGIDATLRKRGADADGKTRAGTLALLVAIGIGLHNL
ncbi:MAG: ZIP family metal transporter, partial [Thermoleophilaceae bacterium]|nr:ZIP family metal transporter [Thermoleophilaceae bacterium]